MTTETTTLSGAGAQVRAADPVALFAAARASGQDAVAWIRPEHGESVVGIGAALEVIGSGDDRLAVLGRRWRALRSCGIGGDPPHAFIGVSFDERPPRSAGPVWDDFPSAVLVVPRLVVECRGERSVAHVYGDGRGTDAGAELDALREMVDAVADRASTSTSAAQARGVRAEALPEPDHWRAQVMATCADVGAGRVEKAVLARTVRVRGPAPIEAVLSALASRSNGSTVFAVARGRSCFVGATPESLVRLDGGIALVDCLAGTAPREADAVRDAERARALAASDKERREHEIVAREARAALARLCDDVASDAPRAVALPNVWHLSSRVRGRVRADTDLIDLAQVLHPTPAVCGHPRDQALRLLAEREPFDRGWYAGALGWIDARGEGELAVALRSALVARDDAWLFAGCGIVAGSDPDAEAAESEAKLRPMLDALGAA